MECNPLQGPLVEEIIQTIEAGQTPQKRHYIKEQIFTAKNLTEEMIAAREYWNDRRWIHGLFIYFQWFSLFSDAAGRKRQENFHVKGFQKAQTEDFQLFFQGGNVFDPLCAKCQKQIVSVYNPGRIKK